MHQIILSRADRNKEIINLNPLRFIRSSSASLPKSVMEDLEKTFNTPVIESYGMTEASHQMTSNPLPPLKRKSGSVGIPAGPEVKILSNNTILRENDKKIRGQIVIKGENVTLGYLNNDKANSENYHNGWFLTGDEGYFDKDEDYHQDNNIFICKYDYTSLRTLARINRWLLIGAKKRGEKTEGNQTGIIEFFNNAENKNIITLMMKALKGIGSNLNKIKSYTDKAQLDYESSDEKFEELFEALSKVGVFFKKCHFYPYFFP